MTTRRPLSCTKAQNNNQDQTKSAVNGKVTCQQNRRFSHGGTRQQRGQANTILLMALGIVAIGAAAFSTDVGSLLVHKQLSQNAANAACAAGAMDLMVNSEGNSLGSFTPGTNFSCSATSTAAPCRYASLNGFRG